MEYKYNQFSIDMGRRIFERRKQLGLTQEQVAERMDVSVQTISYAEQGTKVMRPENIVKLSKILGVTTDYILTGDTPNGMYLPIVNKLSLLSSEEIFFVEMIINSCIGLCNLEKSAKNNKPDLQKNKKQQQD